MRHSVQFTIPWRDLGKSDVEFQVWGDTDKVGTLRVSKGSLVWFAKNGKLGHKVIWSKFSEWMSTMPRVEGR